MKIHKSCPTSRAVFLLGIPDQRGVLHFPSIHSWFPGIHFSPEPGKLINDQLVDAVSEELRETVPGARIQIFQEFAAELPGKDCTLYTGLYLDQRILIPDHWQPLPDLIRKMPADRLRLVCLKAWQILGGVHKEDIKALEYDGPIPND